MNKDQVKNEMIVPNLKSDEELVGFCQAQETPSGWWYFLLGPLMSLGMKFYFVAVTNKGMHFHKLTTFGKPDTHSYFSWDEIEELKLRKGVLQAPLKLTFSNGRKLKLKIQLKGVGNIAKLDDKTKEFLLSKST